KRQDNTTEYHLSDDEYLIMEALEKQSSLKIADITSILNKKSVFPVLQKLIDHGIIVLQEEVNEVYRPKMVRYIRIAPDFADSEALSALLSELKGAKQKDL